MRGCGNARGAKRSIAATGGSGRRHRSDASKWTATNAARSAIGGMERSSRRSPSPASSGALGEAALRRGLVCAALGGVDGRGDDLRWHDSATLRSNRSIFGVRTTAKLPRSRRRKPATSMADRALLEFHRTAGAEQPPRARPCSAHGRRARRAPSFVRPRSSSPRRPSAGAAPRDRQRRLRVERLREDVGGLARADEQARHDLIERHSELRERLASLRSRAMPQLVSGRLESSYASPRSAASP